VSDPAILNANLDPEIRSLNTKYRSRSALLQERVGKLFSGAGELTVRVEPAMIGRKARHFVGAASAREHSRKA
jgi:hypothetical protein